MPFKNVDARFDCAGSRNLGWVAAAGACRDCALVVAPCALLHMVVTFRGRRKGNLVFSWSKVAVRLANANPSEVLQVLLGITLLLFNQAKLFYGRFAKLFPASNRCSLTDKLWANACSQGISRNMSIACNALVDGNLNRHALSVGINTAINMLKRNDMSPSPFRLLEHMVDFLPPPLEGSPGVHKSGRVLKQVTSG